MLITKGRPVAKHAILSLADNALYARHRGPVLTIADRIPFTALGVWAWKEGLLEKAFE